MLRQLHRPLSCLRLIARLQPAPDLLMPPHAPPNWHALVEGLAIQGVEEPVTRGHRAIRPGIRPAYAEKLPAASQSRASLLDFIHTAVHSRGYCGHRKLHPR